MTREEAIRWLEDIHRRFNPTGENLENEGGDVHLQALDMAIEALTERTGEWIKVKGSRSVAKCNRCDSIGRVYLNFCPSCGAKMEGGDDE